VSEKSEQMKLTALPGGKEAPLAQTVPYPKLTYLKRGEQRQSWEESLKNAEVQTHKFYLAAVASPDSDVDQERYHEARNAMDNLRAAFEAWKRGEIS